MRDSMKSGKRFNMIVAILLAVLLWLYVVNVENPNGETRLNNVPIVIQGLEELEERGLMVTELSRQSMDLRVSGKRKTFLKLYRSGVSVVIDVSKITEPGEALLTGKTTISDATLAANLNISDRGGFAVTATVTEMSSKEIPILGRFVGTMASGFEVDTISVFPSTMQISGPTDVISTITHAVAEVPGEAIKADVALKDLPIIVYDGTNHAITDSTISTNVAFCEIQMSIVKVFKLPLAVALNPGGGAGVEDAVVRISPQAIWVSGNEESIGNLRQLVLGRMELFDVFQYKTQDFSILLPPGVVNRSEETTAKVTVDLSKLPMKAVTVSQIEFTNVPDGYQAHLIRNTMQVWVRGQQPALDGLTGSEIRVIVDLSHAQHNTQLQRASAQVMLDTPGVGIIDNGYSVAFQLERS